jgi:hypothetical protein
MKRPAQDRRLRSIPYHEPARVFLASALGAVAAHGQSPEQIERVDFGYSFAPTHFGTLTYRIESDVTHRTIRAEIQPPQRRAAREIVLHLRHPERARMRTVTINGRATGDFDAQNESVRLPQGGPLQVIATY